MHPHHIQYYHSEQLGPPVSLRDRQCHLYSLHHLINIPPQTSSLLRILRELSYTRTTSLMLNLKENAL